MIKGLLIFALLAQPLGAFQRRDEAGPDPDAVRRAGANIQQVLFGKAVLREARRYLGQPYVWGGKSPDEGFDCSGYTQYVFKRLGVNLAGNSLGQYQGGIAIEKPGLMPGDLVFFLSSGAPMHVGIYAGDGKFLHAPATGQVICEESLSKPYFADRYLGARRYAPETKPLKTATPNQEKQP